MRKTLIFIFYTVFIIVMIIGGGMLFKSWTDLRRMRDQVRELEKRLENNNDDILELRQNIYDLRYSPDAIEKVAREKFKLVKENEVVFFYKTTNDKDTKTETDNE